MNAENPYKPPRNSLPSPGKPFGTRLLVLIGLMVACCGLFVATELFQQWHSPVRGYEQSPPIPFQVVDAVAALAALLAFAFGGFAIWNMLARSDQPFRSD
jgi:hypothetical protein